MLIDRTACRESRGTAGKQTKIKELSSSPLYVWSVSEVGLAGVRLVYCLSSTLMTRTLSKPFFLACFGMKVFVL